MKSNLILTSLLAMAALPLHGQELTSAAVADPASPMEKAPTVAVGSMQRRAPGVGQSTLVKADFTVAGQAGSDVTAWSENFDQGKDGWTIDPTTYVTWTTKRIAAAGEAKSFSAIDPDDVASLYVEGPYQTFRREISSAVSPAITVPDNGTLEAWVGFSFNFDDECRMTIDISSDGFATAATLWNSGDTEAEGRPWAWHKVSASLGDYAGQTVKLRFTYGPGKKDSFGTGGYSGDFAIDGITVSGKKAVESIAVATGETVEFVDITEGAVASREWSFPGAVPAVSTEKQPKVYYTADGSYDVTLTVTDTEGKTSTITRPAFVTVTGTTPVAKILPPATFRYMSTRNYMVAPAVPVTFRDASAGFPSETQWMFSGTLDDSKAIEEISGPEATVTYMYQHDWAAGMAAGNSHGASNDIVTVSAENQGLATNLRSDDRVTVFDMEDRGMFPGSNKLKITAYGERFSAPSAPSFIPGVVVYFVNTDAGELLDQISPISVSLYTCTPDGKPDRKLATDSWTAVDIEGPSATGLVGTEFTFGSNPVVNEPFMIVVDGIPEYKEATQDNGQTLITFGMAQFRAEGGTACMLKDGEWIDVDRYFPAGQNHTSFLICPYVRHSIMNTYPLKDSREITVGREAGTAAKQIYSLFGYETPVVSEGWCRVVSEPNGMTLDEIRIAYDALPDGVAERKAKITFTDGATVMDWTLVQNSSSGIDGIEADGPDAAPVYYNLQGVRVEHPVAGQLYIVRRGDKTVKELYR